MRTKHEKKNDLVRRVEREEERERLEVAREGIDCFHFGVIAIKGCKQPSGSVSLLSPSGAHGSTDASLHKPAGKSGNTVSAPVDCVLISAVVSSILHINMYFSNNPTADEVGDTSVY